MDLPFHLLGEPDHLPAKFVADHPCRGQLEAVPAPHGQLGAEFFFHGAEPLADGGQGDALLLRRPGEALVFDEIAEHPHVFELHEDMAYAEMEWRSTRKVATKKTKNKFIRKPGNQEFFRPVLGCLVSS